MNRDPIEPRFPPARREVERGRSNLTAQKLVEFFRRTVPPIAPDIRPVAPTAEEFEAMFDEDGNLRPEYLED